MSSSICFLLDIHLKILGYPCPKDEDGFDVFDPDHHPLRERVKAMENISYYLVAKIDKKEARLLFQTYPCSQPSDSLAFRTSLAKYLENVRHHAVFRQVNQETSWWKDVVVRKSLLEQCCGIQFERLMLALSTHTILTTLLVSPTKAFETYAVALFRCQAEQRLWEDKASSVVQAEARLEQLKRRLYNAPASSYAGVTTSDLGLLVRKRMDDLLCGRWRAPFGERALLFFLSTSGPLSGRTTPYTPPPSYASLCLKEAAVRHLSSVNRLRRPVFKGRSSNPVYTNIQIGQLLEALKYGKNVLVSALQEIKAMTTLLRSQINTLGRSDPGYLSRRPFWEIPFDDLLSVNLTMKRDQALNSADLLHAWNHFNGDCLDNDLVESRIEEIRTSLPPLVPAIKACSSSLPTLSLDEPLDSGKPTSKGPVSSPMSTVFSETERLLDSRLPVPSIGKSSRIARRKSSTTSIKNWFKKRPSVGDVTGEDTENEVDKIISETNDLDTESEKENTRVPSDQHTPKKRKPFIKRIMTAGTPASIRQDAPQPRMPSGLSRLLDVEPLASLPNLASSISSLASPSLTRPSGSPIGPNITDTSPPLFPCDLSPSPSAETALYIGRTNRSHVDVRACREEENWLDDDPPSPTIDEIISSTCISYCDLLEMTIEEVENEALLDLWE